MKAITFFSCYEDVALLTEYDQNESFLNAYFPDDCMFSGLEPINLGVDGITKITFRGDPRDSVFRALDGRLGEIPDLVFDGCTTGFINKTLSRATGLVTCGIFNCKITDNVFFKAMSFSIYACDQDQGEIKPGHNGFSLNLHLPCRPAAWLPVLQRCGTLWVYGSHLPHFWPKFPSELKEAMRDLRKIKSSIEKCSLEGGDLVAISEAALYGLRIKKCYLSREGLHQRTVSSFQLKELDIGVESNLLETLEFFSNNAPNVKDIRISVFEVTESVIEALSQFEELRELYFWTTEVFPTDCGVVLPNVESVLARASTKEQACAISRIFPNCELVDIG